MKLLKENKYVKSVVASKLNVNEDSIRRACKRLNVDSELECIENLKNYRAEVYKIKKPTGSVEYQKGSFVVIPDLHDKWVSRKYLAVTAAFVKDFKPVSLGTLELENGRGVLTLRALDIPGKQAMDVRTVRLKLLQ